MMKNTMKYSKQCTGDRVMGYRYVTVMVSICRDFDEDRGIEVLSTNPLRTIHNLLVDGKAVVETRSLLGRVYSTTNYTYPVKIDGKVKYRTCFVIQRYYLKLPKEMTRNEVIEYTEEITGIKLPVKQGSQEHHKLLEKLFEKLWARR